MRMIFEKGAGMIEYGIKEIASIQNTGLLKIGNIVMFFSFVSDIVFSIISVAKMVK